MKKLFYILALIAVLICGCHKIDTPQLTINDEIANIIGTRSSEPLEGTIWEHQTGDEYNQYIWFNDGQANFFYGKFGPEMRDNGVIEDQLQRWSDFYSAPYTFDDGVVIADISYPEWGKTEKTENMKVFVVENSCTLNVNGKEFKYFSSDASDIDEEMWMIINIGIVPWL